MVKIYSKTELSLNQKEAILQKVTKEFNLKKEEIEFDLDQSIIAGIKLEIDSQIYDLTLNSRLESILNLFDK